MWSGHMVSSVDLDLQLLISVDRNLAILILPRDERRYYFFLHFHSFALDFVILLSPGRSQCLRKAVYKKYSV